MTRKPSAFRITDVSVDKATKLFGAVRAVSALSLTIVPKEVVAVMGANGAGKSTLLSLLSLSARPTRGALTFNGRPGDEAVRGRIGMLSHDAMVYPDLTAEENLLLFAKLFNLPHPKERVDALIDTLGIDGFRNNRPTRVLSRGQLQRTALARAVLHEPDLLLLDEPAAGLDGKAIDRIETVIRHHVETGGMAVVVTHEPDLAARVATRAVFLQRGRLIADGPAPDTADGWRSRYLDVVEGV